MKSSFTGIRPRLLALIGISLLPVALFSLYLAWERQADEIEQASDQVRVVARLVATSHANILVQSQQLLAGLVVGGGRSDDPLMGADCKTHLKRISKIGSLYKQAVLVHTHGTVFCAAEPLPQGASEADRRFFLEAIQKKKSTHSNVVRSGLTGSAAILLAEPVLDSKGQVTALLVAALGLDWIDEYLQRSALPAGSGANLLDAQGMVLAAFPRTELTGQTVADAEEFKAAVRQADEGLMHGIGRDGNERVLAYARFADIPGLGVYIRVGFPKSEIDKAAIETLKNMLIGLALVVVIAIGGGWVGANALVARPLTLLTRAADRLGHGDLNARTGMAHGHNEMGELATKFDELASHVQRKNRALTALSAGNRLILRERDEDLLLKAMCDIAVEKAGYAVAAIFYPQDDREKSLKKMATAGDDRGYLDGALKLTWADTPIGRGTIGTATRTGQRCVIEDVANDVRAEAWGATFLSFGFGSVASFPLLVNDEVIGTFTLVSSHDEAFDDDELELLDEMAADLSFGIATIRARTKLEQAERLAERATSHDLLTDLPNGASFFVALANHLGQAQNENEPLTVLVVHLTHMQELYDSLGYEPGNRIVQEVAGRLRGVEGAGNTLARLGQEDYAVVLPNSDGRVADLVARSILAQFQLPVHASGVQFEIQAAVGASYFPGHGDTADLLVRRATVAAHDAARKGIPYLAYQGTAEREDPQRLSLAADLRQAIEHRDLALHYQQKVDLLTNQTTSCEALLRWKHVTRGMVSPAHFVPIAEQTGLIREMTYFVLDAAVRQQRRWMTAGTPLPIAVNLSVRNLYDAKLIERIDGLLSTWGVPSELIEFEITESALMEEPDTARAAIALLRSRGSKIYIDDFGTGYSSLSYLVSLPVHALKIDRAFVVQMTKTQQAHSVVASIISMAHGLGLKVVAEGVETALELAMLKNLECDVVQGYYTGRPLAAEDFDRRVWPPLVDSAAPQ